MANQNPMSEGKIIEKGWMREALDELEEANFHFACFVSAFKNYTEGMPVGEIIQARQNGAKIR